MASPTYTESFASDFSNISTLQAAGETLVGSSNPQGIPGNIDIINGVYRSVIHSTDTPTNTGIRAEVTTPAFVTGMEYWIDFFTLVNQTEWDNGSSGVCSIGQIHAADSIGTVANELAIVLQNDTLQFYLPATTPPTQGTNTTAYFSIPFIYSMWHRITLHTLLENNNTGFFDIFVDQQPVYRAANTGTAYNSDAPYLKLGCYDSAHTNAFGNSRTAYYSNLKTWTGNSGGYESVLGTGIIPRPNLAGLVI